MIRTRSQRLGALLCVIALTASSAPVAAKDFLLAGVKPDKLVLVDAAARKVERTYTLRDGAPGPAFIVPSPDGKVAYVVVNRWESIVGIDLDSGQEVFRADFSTPPSSTAPSSTPPPSSTAPPERVKAIAAEISPDGKELYVFQSPVELAPDEYHVKDTRIAVYRTADGTAAKPARVLPGPRRTSLLAFSHDGSKLYALSWDLLVLDPATGKVLGRHEVRHWGRPGYGEPDVIDMWPQWEASGILVTPYNVMRSNVPPTDSGAARTGLLSLDLASGEFAMDDFENTTKVIFSGVVNPVRRDEVFLVYATLTKLDRRSHKVVKRIDVDHTYYAINISSDGREVYLGGAMDDIGVYSTDSLKRLDIIRLPGGGDQATASLRLVRR
jgi:quinohemoprotein amine dehydrogenase beta subunit